MHFEFSTSFLIIIHIPHPFSSGLSFHLFFMAFKVIQASKQHLYYPLSLSFLAHNIVNCFHPFSQLLGNHKLYKLLNNIYYIYLLLRFSHSVLFSPFFLSFCAFLNFSTCKYSFFSIHLPFPLLHQPFNHFIFTLFQFQQNKWVKTSSASITKVSSIVKGRLTSLDWSF
jgi:hypothetical protein